MNNKTAQNISKKQRQGITNGTIHARELTPKEIIKLPFFRHRREQPVHWKDSREMNRVIHSFPAIFRAVLLELMDRTMSRHEIRGFINRMGRSKRFSRRITKTQLNLEEDLRKALEEKVLEERDGHGNHKSRLMAKNVSTRLNTAIPMVEKSWGWSA